MKQRQRRVRTFLIVVVVSALLFFVVGFAAVRLGWLAETGYLTAASVVGSIASLVGVLSLARPPLDSDDIENLELDALGRVSQLVRELEDTRRAHAETRGELQQLELQRKQMEASVRSAATLLFLREKVSRQNERLGEKLKADPELIQLLTALRNDYEQLETIGETIATDPNVELLSDVIGRLTRRPETPSSLVEFLGDLVSQTLAKALRP